jgi:hypothetical protein
VIGYKYLDVMAPMFSFLGTMLLDRACISVLTIQNSTPDTPNELSIILLTALPPPPPTPMTLILQKLLEGFIESGIFIILTGDFVIKRYKRLEQSEFLRKE